MVNLFVFYFIWNDKIIKNILSTQEKWKNSTKNTIKIHQMYINH